jgi:hypothetical protein
LRPHPANDREEGALEEIERRGVRIVSSPFQHQSGPLVGPEERRETRPEKEYSPPRGILGRNVTSVAPTKAPVVSALQTAAAA